MGSDSRPRHSRRAREGTRGNRYIYDSRLGRVKLPPYFEYTLQDFRMVYRSSSSSSPEAGYWDFVPVGSISFPGCSPGEAQESVRSGHSLGDRDLDAAIADIRHRDEKRKLLEEILQELKGIRAVLEKIEKLLDRLSLITE